jgi:hypothetical protein
MQCTLQVFILTLRKHKDGWQNGQSYNTDHFDDSVTLLGGFSSSLDRSQENQMETHGRVINDLDEETSSSFIN